MDPQTLLRIGQAGVAPQNGESWDEYNKTASKDLMGEGVEYIEFTLASGRKVVIDVNRLKDTKKVKEFLSPAECLEFDKMIQEYTSEEMMSDEEWEKLLAKTDAAIDEGKKGAKAAAEKALEHAEKERHMQESVYP